MNYKIGKYQFFRGNWSLGLFIPKGNSVYKYILDWTLCLGYLHIHKYKK